MSSYMNFDRQYRLQFGLAGKRVYDIGQQTEKVPFPPHISFSFQKSDLETQNTGRISVWNLNNKQLAALKWRQCVVALRAGYGNRLPLIFAGSVSHSTTERDGADMKTEIEIIDNLVPIRDTYVAVSYNGKVNWKTIFDDVAAQMGVAVTYSYNATFTDVANGFSFVGQGKDIMTRGCKSCGLSWSIQNGVMQVKRPGDTMSRKVFLLGYTTGLIGIPKHIVIGEDEATGKNILGWDVEFMLNGAINVDDYVKLQSKYVSGYFRVYSLEHEGDNVSGSWTTQARLLEVK